MTIDLIFIGVIGTIALGGLLLMLLCIIGW